MVGKVGDAALAGLLQQARAFRSGADVKAARVGWVGKDFDQATALESGNNAAHGGRLDLLGCREFAQSLGTSKHQHGKGRQARRTFAGGGITLAYAAQQVDGGGVQAVGEIKDLGVTPLRGIPVSRLSHLSFRAS